MDMLCVYIATGFKEAKDAVKVLKSKGYSTEIVRSSYDYKFNVLANVSKDEWFVVKNINDYSNRK